MLAAGGGAGEKFGMNARREAEGALISKWKPPQAHSLYIRRPVPCLQDAAEELPRESVSTLLWAALGDVEEAFTPPT